jgi:hypothetical protein
MVVHHMAALDVRLEGLNGGGFGSPMLLLAASLAIDDIPLEIDVA